MRPADPRDVRRHNLSLVLGEVARRGPRSRATLAVETGLNKSTVSSLVAELCAGGLLRESGQERPGAVGRPAQNVELDPDGPFVLGLEVNVDYLAVWATDLAGTVRHRAFTASDNREEPESVVGRLGAARARGDRRARPARAALTRGLGGGRARAWSTGAARWWWPPTWAGRPCPCRG